MQKILIVEDDKKIRNELETFLNKNGFLAKPSFSIASTIKVVLPESKKPLIIKIGISIICFHLLY